MSVYQEKCFNEALERVFGISGFDESHFFRAFPFAMEDWAVKNRDFSIIINSLRFLNERGKTDVALEFIKMACSQACPYPVLADLLSAVATNALPQE